MGYQFIHISAYGKSGGTNKAGKKWSAQDVVSEAERIPGYYEKHVKHVDEPLIVFGVSPSLALQEAEFASESVVDSRGHKMRKDCPILLAGVFSSPDELNEEQWFKLRKNSIDFLVRTFGSSLKTVIEHTDEAHAHCHYFVVPEVGQRALSLHPGHARKISAGSRKKVRTGAQNDMYKAGMIDFQNEYQRAVGVFSGLARFGPKQRRLGRAQWKAEKLALAANREAFELASEVTETVRRKYLNSIPALPTLKDSDPTGCSEGPNPV